MSYKNVLLVGNGPSILHAPYGQVIDEFDGEVVRFNRFVLEPTTHTGLRTDTWVANYSLTDEDLAKLHPELVDKITRVPKEFANTVSKQSYWFRSVGVSTMFWYLDMGYTVILHGFTHFTRGEQRHYFEYGLHEKLWHACDRRLVQGVMGEGKPVCHLRSLLIRKDHWWKKKREKK